MVKPKKRLGQHFLTDKRIAERISSLVLADNCDTIIEVGPGKGILTDFFLGRSDKKFMAVEIDEESVEFLKIQYPEHHEALIYGDFLKTDLGEMGNRLSVVGNFPYNISSQIFFHILNYRDHVSEVVCMLQKEVGLRLASPPGNKQYGILSVFLQAWYTIEVCFQVKPGAFFPPPDVQSVVIRLLRNKREHLPCSESLFHSLVKMAFNQRRKILNNSIKSILVNPEKDIPFLKSRPEELSPDQFIELCRIIEH